MLVTSIGLSIWDSIVKERQKAENADEEGSESEDCKEYTAFSKPEKKKKHSGRCDEYCVNSTACYRHSTTNDITEISLTAEEIDDE